MNSLALACFWVLIAVIVAQAILGMRFLFVVARFRRALLTDEECPRAAVILCLRGSDPFLRRCLEAVLNQDYPNFELRIVVDHPTDPSHGLVEEVLAQHASANVVVQNLQQPREECSLKCSSLVQAVTSSDEAIEIFAQLDADVIPHRSWLRELATALRDEKIAAATGNRWYMPHDVTFGSLVRYAWNAAAVVQMQMYQIAWGGSLAIKATAIRDAGLIERWSQAFCEDTMLFRVLSDKGWKTAFVPSLMMVNRETCDLAGFLRWVPRQLLTARLYHPWWNAVLLHGWGTTLILAITLVMLVAAVVSGSTMAVGWLVAALAIYEIAMFLLLMPIEYSIRRIVHARGENTSWLHPLGLVKLLIAVPATQLVYPRTLLTAMRMRIVEWRGVSYDVAGPWNIRLLSYQPYGPVEPEKVSTASL